MVERGNKVGGRWGRRERADGMQKQVSNFEQTRVTSCWHALLAADMLYEQVSNFEQTVDWRHFSRQSKTIARHAAHQRQGGGGQRTRSCICSCVRRETEVQSRTPVLLEISGTEVRQISNEWY